MSVFDREFNVNELINISPAGLVIADFNKIRDTLINLNKNIYGHDIDMSAESPDVQYLTIISLIINNILKLSQVAFNNLDPNLASGKYLTNLCTLSNIKRYGKSYSKASVYVKNITGNEIAPENITFVDKNNNNWIWQNNSVYGGAEFETKWKIDEIKLIEISCETPGPIQAFGNKNIDITDPTKWDNYLDANGDIYQTIEYDKFQVLHKFDAILGRNEESDNDLRVRYTMSQGSQSVSVLSGLKSALLNIPAISDCWIYNNIDINDIVMADGHKVKLHDIYICLRYDNLVEDSIIGKLIYNKLTPGIKTSELNASTPAYGTIVKYSIDKSATLKYNIYWKKCAPITLSDFNIQIKLTPNISLYDFSNNPTEHSASTLIEESITNAIINYLNNISLGEDLSLIQLNSAIQSADITKNNLSTFIVNTSSSNNTNLKLSYFNIKSENIKFTENISNSPSITIDIK